MLFAESPLPKIVDLNLKNLLIPRSPENTLRQRPFKHTRKQRENIDTHGRIIREYEHREATD